MKMTVVTSLALLLSTAAQAGYQNVPSYVYEVSTQNESKAQAALNECKADLAQQTKLLVSKGAKVLSVKECSLHEQSGDQSPTVYTVSGMIQFL